MSNECKSFHPRQSLLVIRSGGWLLDIRTGSKLPQAPSKMKCKCNYHEKLYDKSREQTTESQELGHYESESLLRLSSDETTRRFNVLIRGG